MKRYRFFMVMATIVALMLPCNAKASVQVAAKTAAENMTVKNIAKLYKVRTEAENPDQREVIIQACIAGLYAIGDTKNAKKINQDKNRDGFIHSLMKECDLCRGEGRSQVGCYKCKGSGACQNWKCKNGTVIGADFGGRSNVRKCSNCGGSGKCTNCKGTGKVARTCSRCNGSKRVINKAIALASCKDMLNALIACGNEIQSRKKAEGATQLAQQMVEKEKQARERADSDARLAEQKAENEKRAREKAEKDVHLAWARAESEKEVRGGADAIPHNAKGSGQTNVVMPANARSLEEAFPSSYKTVESVVIQDGVTSIGRKAFEGCTGLTSVVIPDSVTEIGDYAFSGCSGLTKVTIGKKVRSIGESLFEGCTGLTSVVMPDSVTEIGDLAFSGCSGLTSVMMPEGVTSIGRKAFKGCTGLTSVVIPDSVTEIGDYAFNGCSGLTKVVIGKKVRSIGRNLFGGCSGVTSVTMPVGMQRMKYGMKLWEIFPNAYKTIKSVVIQGGETDIGMGAFEWCRGLTSVTIPRSVTSIGDSAFRGCTGLTSVVIPNSVTSICCHAFSECSALTSLTLPQSLKKLGYGAFERCEKLESFGNKEFKGGDISTEAFAGTQYTVMDIDGVKCIKSTKDAVQIKQNDEFKKNLAEITSKRECFEDGCEIMANEVVAAVLKRKSEGFNYVLSGRCNGVSNTRLYYRWHGLTLTEDVDWSYDISYLILSDESKWTNWMDALKIVHVKVIEWVDVAAKNGINEVEKEIPIGRIEVFAHNNMITKGKGQQKLYASAVRRYETSDEPVKFFCKMSDRYGRGMYSGEVTARCGYFKHEILRFHGDKTGINNDILLQIERYNPEALKKAYLEHARKQDMFK